MVICSRREGMAIKGVQMRKGIRNKTFKKSRNRRYISKARLFLNTCTDTPFLGRERNMKLYLATASKCFESELIA